MSANPREEALALAAIAQGVSAVRELARQGHVREDAVGVAASSALRIDSQSVDDVFGGPAPLRHGLEALRLQLRGPRGPAVNEVARYAVGVLKLANDVMTRKEVAAQLQAKLEAIAPLHEASLERAAASGEADTTSDAVIEQLADAYRECVSTLGPRIMVFGDQTVLERPDNAARVRVLLLGAVRAAVLWRQLGGSRLRLVFVPGHRARLDAAAAELLADV